MATRPIFVPCFDTVGVIEDMLEFKWHPGMALVQKKKSIYELHQVANNKGYKKILEISSKSEDKAGIELSAFNLTITTKKKGNKFSVESAFQGSKVFEEGGPYLDLLNMESLKAKKDIRLRESGNLIGFRFFGKDFPIIPRTFFYDWIYINALVSHHNLSAKARSYDAYSDIEFNPKKSINCQAHSVALYVSLYVNKVLEKALQSPESFLEVTRPYYKRQNRNTAIQNTFI